jgi:hypothetical protein
MQPVEAGGEAEIGELDVATPVQQNIVRFDITGTMVNRDCILLSLLSMLTGE